MSLPKLPELTFDALPICDNNFPKETSNPSSHILINKEPKSNKRKRPIIPKSEYDSDGKPILTIPEINDIQLSDEIDKYFGKYEEED